MKNNDDNVDVNGVQNNQEEGFLVAESVLDSEPKSRWKSKRRREKDDSDDDDAWPGVNTARWKILALYMGAALVAFTCSLVCPKTKLWMDKKIEINSVERNKNTDLTSTDLNRECFLELTTALILTILSLLAVQGSDPGYLDAETVLRLDEEDGIASIQEEQESNETFLRRRTCNETTNEANNMTYSTRRRKVCNKCGFAPPLRAHHCKYCDKCVATFDHHCLFIGTCIGERNHCRFWWFLTFQLVGFLTCDSIVSSSQFTLFTIAFPPSPPSLLTLLCKIYLYPLTLIAAIMWISHTCLAISNLTTFECSKGPKHIDYLQGTRDCDLPFSSGLDSNIRTFCCLRDKSFTALIARQRGWTPVSWTRPATIIRDSDDWWEHPWQNKYYSCC